MKIANIIWSHIALALIVGSIVYGSTIMATRFQDLEKSVRVNEACTNNLAGTLNLSQLRGK